MSLIQVVVVSFDDFKDELEFQQKTLDGIVRCTIGVEYRNEVTAEVSVHASAICVTPSQNPFLLRCSMDTGTIHRDQDESAHQVARELFEDMASFCKEHEFQMRPGQFVLPEEK